MCVGKSRAWWWIHSSEKNEWSAPGPYPGAQRYVCGTCGTESIYWCLVLGNIIDGTVGAFAGNIVGKSYTWEDPTEGAELLDTHAAGGSCDAYSGCMSFFLPPAVGTSFSRRTTTTRTTIQTTSRSTSTTTDIGIDTATDTLTKTATVTQDAATATETETASATATVINTETFLEKVEPVTTTIVQGAVTNTVTLIENTVIEKVASATVTLLPEPVFDTVIVLVDRNPEAITVSGETIILPGETRAFTREIEDTHVHGPEEYTTETYTTTVTEPSTYTSTYTTTRLLHSVFTYTGEGTTVLKTFVFPQVDVPFLYTALPDPASEFSDRGTDCHWMAA